MNRVLCLGCPYLVPRPEHADRVLGWEKAYLAMAAECTASGGDGEPEGDQDDERQHRFQPGPYAQSCQQAFRQRRLPAWLRSL